MPSTIPSTGPTRTLALVGGGGHALVVAEAAAAAGFLLAGVYDDNPACPAAARMGLPILGRLHDAAAAGHPLIIAVGDTTLRRTLAANLGKAHALTIDAGASIAKHAAIGRGVFLGRRAVVQPFASIADHAIINTGAIIEHECTIGPNAHIAPGAVLGGNVTVGEGTLIGIGARVIPGITIGAGAVVGAGATVVRNVPDGAKVIGVPARQR